VSDTIEIESVGEVKIKSLRTDESIELASSIEMAQPFSAIKSLILTISDVDINDIKNITVQDAIVISMSFRMMKYQNATIAEFGGQKLTPAHFFTNENPLKIEDESKYIVHLEDKNGKMRFTPFIKLKDAIIAERIATGAKDFGLCMLGAGYIGSGGNREEEIRKAIGFLRGYERNETNDNKIFTLDSLVGSISSIRISLYESAKKPIDTRIFGTKEGTNYVLTFQGSRLYNV